MSRDGVHKKVFERSNAMRAIRKTNTKPELAVRRILHAAGFRFRLYRRDLPGSPDIVLPKHQAIVLVHGCFWHQHAKCHLAKLPRARPHYWLPKLARNKERDAKAEAELTKLGWRVLVVWECEVGNHREVSERLSRFLLRSKKVA